MNGKKFYITTAIYYVNDVPHIGSASEAIAADVLARYKRLCGHEVFFLTGTDENAPKVKEAAEEAGEEAREFVERMVEAFKEAFEKLKISYDYFIRTTSSEHIGVTQTIFHKLLRDGIIYKGRYEGWYCIHEETFYLPSELTDDKCPECRRPLRWIAEENYFFNLSRYQNQVLQYLEAHPELVQPAFRYNEVISYIKGGLKDACISRKARGWGIPVPGEADYVIYVWFDALVNYLTGIGHLKDEGKFNHFWPPDIQIIGKDILPRFHATLWPAMLFAVGLPLPKSIFAHGHWTVDGKKMSKSLGNQIDPCKLSDDLSAQFQIKPEIAVDAIRYYLLREVPFGLDGDFSIKSLLQRFNADLANDLGNLLNRTLPMVEKYFGGKMPKVDLAEISEGEIAQFAQQMIEKVEGAMERVNFSEALICIWQLVNRANKYIEESAPWRLSQEGKIEQLAKVIYNIAEALRIISLLISPFMPEVAEEIQAQMGLGAELEKISWEDTKTFGKLPPGLQVQRAQPIFPRIE